jgi:hypothetical protein
MNPAPEATLLRPPWGRVPVPTEAPAVRRIGPRDVWLLFREGEIRVATALVPPESIAEEPSPQPPDGNPWARWATPEGERDVMLRPAFPNRAVVLEPEVPFSLLPRSQARIFVRVPLWIRVEVADGDRTLLQEIPTVEMSDTWWGGFLEGELCYWLPITARREVRPELMAPHLAVCPLHLTNRSLLDLEVERLTLRMVHLSLFQDELGFWSDESTVRYQGEAEGSQLEMSGRPPREAIDAVKVADPRVPVARGFRARTFARFRALHGLGGHG